MPLKDAGAAVVVDVVRQRVHDVLQPLQHDAVRHALAQRKDEHVEE